MMRIIPTKNSNDPASRKNMYRILSLLILAVITTGLWAQEPAEDHGAEPARPVTGIYSLGIGSRRAVSRYLAPVRYTGTEYSFSGRWSKAMPFAPEKAMMEFDGGFSGGFSYLNPRKNSSMQGISADFAWNMRRMWRLPMDFTLTAGGGIELDAGALALLKNSNNPVNIELAAAFGAAASASWVHTVGRLPMAFGLDLRAPLLGAFFMPGYGETYYEISVGNHSGLVHFGWPGSRRQLKGTLSVKMDFGKTAMEVGYAFRWSHAAANNLMLSSSSNMFTIGVIPGGLGLKRKMRQIRPIL